MILVWPPLVPSFMQSISLQTTAPVLCGDSRPTGANATHIRIEADASTLVNMLVLAPIETLYEFAHKTAKIGLLQDRER